ncbi:MAG TPA: xanthine dehydrogenase family protein subunit M [Streptosporangiaceae bacterium]|jgi:carbon-monoxide dehydrogenase medium subunit|nr:xanthine dehydrogenase family protein subunit M [Streptosporangiaceae bacterium]
MVAPAFDYVAAGSYDEAVRLLAASNKAGGDEAKILAGGQSLMPMLNLRLAHPELLIDINPADQRPPALADGLLRLPALTRHRVLLEHDLVREHCPLLAEAVRHVGNVRVRNRGTIGGSLAHADPTSEIGCCALATGARVVVRGPDGERTIPASDLFAGYWSTSLDPAEIITDVLIPAARPRQGWSFHEMVRRTSDFAIVAVAVIFNMAERTGEPASATVALAGVADRVVLADPELLTDDPDESAARIADSLGPADDVHASGAYRRRLARVLTARALREASARAAL